MYYLYNNKVQKTEQVFDHAKYFDMILQFHPRKEIVAEPEQENNKGELLETKD